jgi:hypothetical protein
LRLWQRCEQSSSTCVISKRLADVRETVDVAGAENEAPAELEGIGSEFVLAMAGSARPLPGSRIVPAEEVQQIRGTQFRHPVNFALPVDQERKGDARILAKRAGIMPVTQPDGRQSRTLLPEGLLAFAQLRDVFPAKDSTVVTEEDQHGGLAGPQ